MLPLLIYQNRVGKFQEGTQGGFLDKRQGPSKLYCGVYRYLHKKTSAFPALSKKEWLSRRSRKPLRSQKSSSKRTGSYCHVQVQHALLCSDKCQCEAKGVVRKQSPAYAMVQAAKRFVEEQKLVPLCGEMIIVEPRWGLGTKFDMLCERAEGHHVLVSWKTTGLCPFVEGLKRFNAEILVCQVPNKTSSSECLAAREHAAQLALEVHMLQTQHNVPIRHALVVYLNPEKTEYRAVAMEDVQSSTRIAEWIAKKRL
jgi:CRISPR/Cas system-associated exonuclease Cas4 (RecB family)